MSRDERFEALLAQAARLPRPRELGLLQREPPPTRIGRFDDLVLLGSGGMGTVYAATDPKDGAEVAIKVMHPHLVTERGAERLAREAAVLAALDHPNLVRFVEQGCDGGRVYLVMERVRGTTLADWQRTPRPPSETYALLAAVAAGLEAAHTAGFVHRDFKPANVLVDHAGVAKIADFGLVKHVGADMGHGFDTLTQTGAILGTPAYMAPEQIKGGPIDTRTDQFAFCAAAWEAIAGRHPFATSKGALPRTPVEATLRHREGPSGWTNPGQSELRGLLARGLEERSADRHPNLTPLRVALSQQPPH